MSHTGKEPLIRTLLEKAFTEKYSIEEEVN